MLKHIIIGTAGHVDHGKSALIKALTGIETDRLKEEKMRGISIDLGFAVMRFNEELVTSIVDVPGHERFLKNMLAGTGGIDLAMLVIAADEGIMPQTKEHLAMLQLYGIQHGIVVITKIDKVDKEWLELIEEEILLLLKDTFLAKAPLCRISAITGAGLEELKTRLLIEGKKIIPRDAAAPFRMWIDRVFVVKGHGTVVTGSVLSGTCHTGDCLTLYPSKEKIRVRGIECHGHKVETIFAGQRAAINIAGAERDQVTRGMFLSQEGYGLISNIWDAEVDCEQKIGSGTRVRLHLGTGEFLGRIYFFKTSKEKYIRLIMEKPLAGSAGDKGVIRLYSPQHLLGGIMLIAPGKQRRIISEERIKLAQALRSRQSEIAICQILAEGRSVMSSLEIIRQVGYVSTDQVVQSLGQLEKEKKIIPLDSSYINKEVLDILTLNCTRLLADYHRNEPNEVGLSRELLRRKIEISEKAFDKILMYWQRKGHVSCSNGEFALPKHLEKICAWRNELLLRCQQIISKAGLLAIDKEWLCAALKINPEKSNMVMTELLNQGVLIKVENICISRIAINNVIVIVCQYFRENQTITVAQFRDLLNTSRKIALLLLHYLDVNKYTVRTGDIRQPTQKIVDFSEQ